MLSFINDGGVASRSAGSTSISSKQPLKRSFSGTDYSENAAAYASISVATPSTGGGIGHPFGVDPYYDSSDRERRPMAVISVFYIMFESDTIVDRDGPTAGGPRLGTVDHGRTHSATHGTRSTVGA